MISWYDDHVALIEVGRFIEEHDGFIDQADVIDYFDKPWRYRSWYLRWCESKLLDALAISEEHHA